ncbi:MAG: signal peptidase II [Desulfobacterales bacterium]|nr:signal peptidase II [Desulfobacterales bacterium]
MKKKYLITIAIVLGVILLDQCSKIYIDRVLPLYYSIPIVKNFIHITYIRNTGAAFGLLASRGTGFKVFFFFITSIIAIIVILFFLRSLKDTETLLTSSLSLIMGGAIGNLIDRVRLGEVIDFIDFHWYSYHWPAFNVADSAITVGGVFLIVNTVLRKDMTQ